MWLTVWRCIDDPRCQNQVIHSLADMIGFRMKIAAGYEDGNDANGLRSGRPSGRVGQKSAPTCNAWCGRSEAIGRTPGS
ncbi:hypothetical protein [Mesorhizobium sp.]|uniref:hypothetical protein n=1 Tax=Mesorhizobium sp. TaxID=1871066 RepID=UPI0025C3BB52|nr:hypothetical protein [Mesorhizobium sp.]